MILLKSRSIEDREQSVRRHLWMTHMCEFDEIFANRTTCASEPAAILDYLESTICSYATLSPLVLEQAMLCRDAKHLEVTDLARIAEGIAAELLDYSVMEHRCKGIELKIEKYREWLDLHFPPEMRNPFDTSQSYSAFRKISTMGTFEHGKPAQPRRNRGMDIPSKKTSGAMAVASAV